MANVIGVRFQNAGKLYFFDPGTLWPTPGDFVVVETTRGVEFGEVVTGVREISDEQLTSPLKPVIRVATAEDVQHAKDNKAAEKEAYAVCQKKIGEHKLDMKLVSVEYTFDNSKILFYFTANGRVDFRGLVKDLASVFKTRIELRQIGVRDEAKMLGGLGPCGRPICCGAFLGDFQHVTIKMAKEQNLSLNPNKISGVCGRLMCCLKYEEETYEQTRKRMPKVGKEVVTPDGNGVVWDLNIIKETVRVRIQKGDTSELRDYPVEEVQRVGQPVKQDKPVADPAAAEEAREEQPVEAQETPTAENAPAEQQPARGPRGPRKGDQPRRERPRNRGERHEEGGEKQPKPARRENPHRQLEKDEQSAERPARKPKASREEAVKQDKPAQSTADKPAQQSASEKPAQQPAADKPAQPKPQQASASPWKAAVERALQAAKGENTQE